MAKRYQQRRLPPPKPPPIKWQNAKTKTQMSMTNEKTIYSIKNGKVLAVSIDNVQSLKKSPSDVSSKGVFYRIEMPESLAKKYNEPQTKLWYYDKNTYRPRTASEPQKPSYKIYSITKPDEESIDIPDDALAKTPVPNTDQAALEEEAKKAEQAKETLPVINNSGVNPNGQLGKKPDGTSADAPDSLPPLVKSTSGSLYTLQSIDRSFRKYRF